MPSHLPRLATLVALLSAAACSDWRVRLYDGPPVGTEVTMPPPTSFAECREPTHRHERIDVDRDGRTDAIRVVDVRNVEVCRGTDTNQDGRIDTWDVLAKGKVVKRAHDSDGNGLADQVWTWQDALRPSCATFGHDENGDGTIDGANLDLCALVKTPPPAPLAPLAAPQAGAAGPTR
jgi:hypothetical protein